eukprot:8839463-Pyramimonas_sp.AAC.1
MTETEPGHVVSLFVALDLGQHHFVDHPRASWPWSPCIFARLERRDNPGRRAVLPPSSGTCLACLLRRACVWYAFSYPARVWRAALQLYNQFPLRAAWRMA